VSASKIDDLFDTLRAACARQFGFNPRRVTEGMRYVGKEGHGKDLVHVFKDVRTHSQIALKNTFVTLREKQGDKPHWTEAEKARYKNTNAEIDAELAEIQAKLDYTQLPALPGSPRTIVIALQGLAGLSGRRGEPARSGKNADRLAGRCTRCTSGGICGTHGFK
jgi:hypothetical protein